jgi:hypothetical protein
VKAEIKITDRLRHGLSMNPDRDEYRAEVLERAADYIERLEACVRAADVAIDIPNEPTTEIREYLAARARVTLPPSPTSDGTGEGGGNGK